MFLEYYVMHGMLQKMRVGSTVEWKNVFCENGPLIILNR